MVAARRRRRDYADAAPLPPMMITPITLAMSRRADAISSMSERAMRRCAYFIWRDRSIFTPFSLRAPPAWELFKSIILGKESPAASMARATDFASLGTAAARHHFDSFRCVDEDRATFPDGSVSRAIHIFGSRADDLVI